MKGWKLFFWIAAAYNWLAGIPLYIAPAAMVDFVGGASGTADLALMKITGALIVCFGIVLAVVVHDPIRFRVVLWSVVVGKLGLGLVFVGDWFLGTIPWSTITLSLVDLTLNVIVLFFLFRRPLKSQLAGYQAVAA